MEGYKVHDWETSLELLDQRTVYVLTSGQVILRWRGGNNSEGYAENYNRSLPSHAHIETFECFPGEGRTWSRHSDCLDGQLPFHVDRSGRVEPGRVSDNQDITWRLEDLERTTTWFIRALAAHLQA